MSNARLVLAGVFAPVVTPFRGEALDLEALRSNLRKLRQTDLTGYLALGSNGEYRSLSDKEQVSVLEVFAEEKGDKLVMVGTGYESTHLTVERSKLAASMGFGYVSVLTPGYFAKFMDGPALESFFLRIAEEVPVPVILYNAPGFTGGVQIPPKVVKTLAEHKSIVGMKDSSPQGPARYLNELSEQRDFSVIAGSANFFYPSLHLGADGGILSLANILPEACCELYSLFRQGLYNKARDLHFRLTRLNGAVSGKYGVAGVKAAMDIMGFCGGEPRHPLQPVGEDGKEAIKKAISGEGFSIE